MDLVTHKRVALIALATLAACTEPDVRRPGLLAVTSGEAQEADVGTELPAPVEVQVTDTGGRTVPRVVVNFRVSPPAGTGFTSGSVNPASAETDAGGTARVRWTLGTGAGSYTLHAWIGPSEAAAIAKAELHATAQPGVAVSMARASEPLIAITVGDSVQVAVAATDRYGNRTSRFTGLAWHVLDPGVGSISRADVASDDAAIVVATAPGAAVLEARDPTVGTLRFDLRTYVGPGRDIAFASFTDELRQTPGIFLLAADGASVTLLTRQYAADPAWSPDGRQIAFTGRVGDFSSAIYVMNADGSGVRALTDAATVGAAAQPAWSPDGQTIAFVARALAPNEPPLPYPVINALFVMNADGSAPRRVALPDHTLCRGGVCWAAQRPVWSPDGTRIAYAFRTTSFSRTAFGAIFIVSADGSGLRQLPTGDPSSTFASEPAWSPDGGRIAFARAAMRVAPVQISAPQLYAVGVDGTGLTRLTGSASQGFAQTAPAWAADGRLTFGRHLQSDLSSYHHTWVTSDLFVANADGSEARRVARPPGGVSRPAWRPTP